MGALPPQATAEELIERTNRAGGTDNVTVVVAAVLSIDPVSANGTPGANAALLDDSGFGRKFARAARRLSPSG